MKPSKISSLLGIISLGLVICSCIINPKVDYSIAYSASFVGGIVFSVIFIIPSIFLFYFEVRFPELSEKELKKKWISPKRRAAAGASAGSYFSVGYAITFLIWGLFTYLFTIEYEAPSEGNPILRTVVVFLFILIGILGIVAALVYRDDRSPNVYYLKLKFLCKICGAHSNTGRGYCKKCGAHAFRKALLWVNFKPTTRLRKFINKLKKSNSR